jgi:CBS domain-containing protein
MRIRDILRGKEQRRVATVDSNAPVAQAVAEMVASNVGSVLVLLDGAVEGIFTERDALRLWRNKEKVQDEAVLKFMTQELVIVGPDDSTETALSIMSQKNFRHLLVVDGQKLLNVLSIKDLVKAYVGTLQSSIRTMDKVLL